MTSFIRSDEMVATAAAFGDEGGRIPPVGWASGFAIADGWEVDGRPAGAGRWSKIAPGDHALAYGIVDAAASSVTVSVGSVERRATLSDETLSVRVERSGGKLTREGRRLLERLPRTIEIRTFAAAFAPGSLARVKGHVRPLTFTCLRGGTVVRQAALPVHVRRRAGPGRAHAMPRGALYIRAGSVDRALFARVARRHTPWLDRTLPRLSVAANHAFLWVGVSAVLVRVAGEPGRRAAVRGMGSVVVTSAIVNLAVKRAVRRPRPALAEVPAGRRLQAQPLTTSFPSGHAASATAFAVGAGSEIPVVAPLLAVTAAAVAYSRIYVGVHYPGDVVAGIGIGAAVAAGSRTRALPRLKGERGGSFLGSYQRGRRPQAHPPQGRFGRSSEAHARP